MSMTDYSDLEQEINEVPDLAPLPNDTEATVRIVGVKPGAVEDESKETYGLSWILVEMDVPDFPNCPSFTHFMWELNSVREAGDEKRYNGALRSFKQFAQAFRIDLSVPFSWDGLIGLTADAVLRYIKDTTGDFPDKNGIRKFIIPK